MSRVSISRSDRIDVQNETFLRHIYHDAIPITLRCLSSNEDVRRLAYFENKNSSALLSCLPTYIVTLTQLLLYDYMSWYTIEYRGRR